MQIDHTFDPYLIRIYGDFGIRWYSLAYILGFVLVQWYLRRAARAGEIPNLDENGVDGYVVSALIGALVGARFFHVFVFEFADYGFDPLASCLLLHGNRHREPCLGVRYLPNGRRALHHRADGRSA